MAKALGSEAEAKRIVLIGLVIALLIGLPLAVWLDLDRKSVV